MAFFCRFDIAGTGQRDILEAVQRASHARVQACGRFCGGDLFHGRFTGAFFLATKSCFLSEYLWKQHLYNIRGRTGKQTMKMMYRRTSAEGTLLARGQCAEESETCLTIEQYPINFKGNQNYRSFGRGSKIGAQNGTLVNGTKDCPCLFNFDPYPFGESQERQDYVRGADSLERVWEAFA